MHRDDLDIDRELDLYLDGELDDPERAAVEARLSRCESTQRELENRAELRERLHGLAEATCPASLRQRIEAQMASERSRTQPGGSPMRYAAMGLAAAVVLAVAGFGVSRWIASPDETPASGQVAGAAEIRSPVVEQSVRWHRRQVPVEVTGPDATRVRAWFDDKVAFAVRVPEFADRSGVQLLGGRLGNVEDQDAAFLVYDVDGVKLSVLLFDAARIASGAPVMGSDAQVYVDNSSGYSVAVQERDGVGYTFTSALPEERLVELVDTAAVH